MTWISTQECLCLETPASFFTMWNNNKNCKDNLHSLMTIKREVTVRRELSHTRRKFGGSFLNPFTVIFSLLFWLDNLWDFSGWWKKSFWKWKKGNGEKIRLCRKKINYFSCAKEAKKRVSLRSHLTLTICITRAWRLTSHYNGKNFTFGLLKEYSSDAASLIFHL